MPGVDYSEAVNQEVAYLRKVHPSVDDIPTCTNLLDTFLKCHVLTSQVKSLYRYGARSSCGDKFEDFKFCLSLRSMHPEEKREAWIHRRAEWWATRRVTQSSEDVWESRTEPLKNFPASLPSNLTYQMSSTKR